MKQSITFELNKIKEMSKEQKWDYFKSYYLVKTVFIVIGIVLLIWLISDLFFQKEPVNAGCVYGIEVSDELKYALTDGYVDYYGYNPKKYCAYISTDNMFEGTEQQMDANAHEMALFAQIAAGDIYYLILDEENLMLMSNGDIYYSMDELFPHGLPDRFIECGVSLTDKETGNAYLAAIDLKKAGIINSSVPAYLVFTVGINDMDYPQRFLNYLDNMHLEISDERE